MSMENSPMKVDTLKYTTSLLLDKRKICGKDKQNIREQQTIYEKREIGEQDRICVCCKNVRQRREFTRLIHSCAGQRKQMTKIFYKIANVRITYGIVCYSCERSLLHVYRLLEKYRKKILNGLDELIEQNLIKVDFDQDDCDSDKDIPFLSRNKQIKPKTYPDILKIEMEKVYGTNSLSDAPDGMTLILQKSDAKEVHSGNSTKIPYIITSQKPINQSKSTSENKAFNETGIGILKNYSRLQKQNKEIKSTVETPSAVDESSGEVQIGHGMKKQTDTVVEKPKLKRTNTEKTSTSERRRQVAQITDSPKNPNDNTSQKNVVQIKNDNEIFENSGEEFVDDLDFQTHQTEIVEVSLANQSAGIVRNAIPIQNIIPIQAKPAKNSVSALTQNSNSTTKHGLHATQTPDNRVSGILQQNILSQAVEKKNTVQSQQKRLGSVFANVDTNNRDLVVCEKPGNSCEIKWTKNSATTSKNLPQVKQMKSGKKTQINLSSRNHTKVKPTTIQSAPRTIKRKEPLPQVLLVNSPLVLQNSLIAHGLQQPIQINHPLILQNQVKTVRSNCQQATASSMLSVSQVTKPLPNQVSAKEINCTKANALIIQSLPQAKPQMILESKVNASGMFITKVHSMDRLCNSQAPIFASKVRHNPLKHMQIDAKQGDNIQDYAIKNIEFLSEETLEASTNNPLENGAFDGSHDKTTVNDVSVDKASFTNLNQTDDNENDNLNHEFECETVTGIEDDTKDKVEKVQAVGNTLKIQNVFSLKQTSNKENLCKVRTDQVIHIDSQTILSYDKRRSKPRPILPKAMPEVPVKPVSIELKKMYVKMDHKYAAERNAKRKRKVEEYLPRKVVIDRIRCRKLHNTNLNPHVDHTYKTEKTEVQKKPRKQKRRKTRKPQKQIKQLNGKTVNEVVGIENYQLQEQIDSDDKVTEIQGTRKACHLEENNEEKFFESSDDMSEMEDMVIEDTKLEKRRRIVMRKDIETQLAFDNREEMYEGGVEDYYSDNEVYTATRLLEQPAVETVLNEHVDDNIANVVPNHIQEFDLMQDLYTTTI